MTWYDKDWQRRAPITIDLHGGTGTIEVDTIIPREFPAFWGHVLNSGNDVRIVDASGVLLTYKLVGFDVPTRAGNIEIDNWLAPNVTRAVTAWLYWDNAAAASAASTFTIGLSPKTGIIEVGSPGTGSEHVVVARAEQAGADNSETVLSKHPDDITHIWWNCSPALLKRRTAEQESLLHEEIESATYTVLNAAGAVVGAMIDAGSMRTMHPGWVRTTIQDGVDDTNYVAKLTVSTTLGRTLTFHASIKVRIIHAPT
jgi:hypothetical protein